MASETDIANYAQDLLGDDPITDLDAETQQAGRLKRAFQRSRDELQRLYAWTRFIVRTSLSKDAAAPEWGFTARYLMPSECLRVVDVYVGDIKFDSFYPEGQYILANTDGPLQIRYLKRNTEVGYWDPLFNAALAYHMAMGICESVNESKSLRQLLMAGYQKTVKDALRANAIEVESTPVNDPSRLEQVRIGGYGILNQSRY